MESCLRGLRTRGFAPKHIVDVGASCGPWTKMCLPLWPAAKCSLFEPLIEHASALYSMKQSNPNIAYFPHALGRQSTKLPISIYPDQLDAGSLAYGGPGSREVAVEPLDDILAAGQILPAELLKIDVQGFEEEVLLGAKSFLKSVEVLITETYFFRFAPRMKLFQEMVGFMDVNGFRVYEVLDPLPRPYDQATGQCDICFVREGHPLLSSNAWS